MEPAAGRRASFSLDEKRRVLEHLRGGGRVRETIALFYPQLPPERYDARRRLVLSWRRQAREILAGAATRQGAARRRIRRPKTPKPRPPIPRGLVADPELQEEPFTEENGQELDPFEPIELLSSRTSRMQQQDQEQQDREQDQDGGIQDLIATAVEQSVRQSAEEQDQDQDGAEDAGLGAGRDEKDKRQSQQEEAETRTSAASQQATKRSSFSLNEKRRVLEHLAKTKNVRATIDEFYPDLPPEEYNTRRRAIWRWRQCAEQIVAGCADDKASARKKMRPRGIVCHRGPRHVKPQAVVDRLLTSVKKSEQWTHKRKGNRELRPAPPAAALLAERQIDSLVFSSLGLPPTTQFPPIQPALTNAAGTAASAASVSTMRPLQPLQRGEATFAIRRR